MTRAIASSATLQRKLRSRLLLIPGVVQGADVFSDGDAFWMNGTEIAYFTEGALDLRLTRKRISAERDAIASMGARRHSPSSDWISIPLRSLADADLALRLMQSAADAHRPPPGVHLKPPPEGVALARRRRFH